MNRTAYLAVLLWSLALSVAYVAANDPTRVLEPGKLPADRRLNNRKTLDGYFPMTPPAGRESWELRRKIVREQVLVATGLWPMPEKTPLRPVIHGKIDRDDYTIEKVFFASYPGHYVSGNLYRPKENGLLPGVLCPHGHWPNGRFFDALSTYGEKRIQDQIKSGAEKTVEGARFPLQARCAQLARMGCVVFHYDMVGNADSKQIEHTAGFTDVEAELRLQSFMGLQTYNSVRALDFLLSLPEVDSKRIGVTGASGGGTQTFVLCAIDDRPAVALPAVMVSTAMQGGCICENCSYLRQNTGNIELAGLFAPKPLGMTAANDWTKEIETKGLPELKALYRLYGVKENVMARAFLQFDHNYNQVSREVMYNWFNKHLHLSLPEPIAEKPFVPIPPKQLSVYDAEHPRPADATSAVMLRKHMTEASDKQLTALRPRDAESLGRFRHVVGTALRVMIGEPNPLQEEIESQLVVEEEGDDVRWQKLLLGRKGSGEQVPAVLVRGRESNGAVAVWIHPAGKASLLDNGKLIPAARRILEKKASILAVDVFLTGEFQKAKPMEVDRRYAGYTFGYNQPLLANRVHDILTAVTYAKQLQGAKTISLIGFEKAGPWVLLARALCGDAVVRTAVDLDQFRFENVNTTSDEMLLPGALKYGGLPAGAALCAPSELLVANSGTQGWEDETKPAYAAVEATAHFHHLPDKATNQKLVEWLTR